MTKKISLSFLTIIVLAFVIAYVIYLDFRREQLGFLVSGSQVVNTSAGPIEYQTSGGSGPILLFLHGTPGGYDQLGALSGFRFIAPSRPGYLRTPLSVGRSPEEQAPGRDRGSR